MQAGYDGKGQRIRESELEATAALFAAAPEMLSMLKWIGDELAGYAAAAGQDSTIVRAIRTVVAQAEGREP